VWKDRLTSFDGVSISYDQIGNPLNWHDGATLTWQHGRQLASYSKDGTTISYVYNADGIRTAKIVNGVTTSYTVTDGTLRRMTSGDNTLEFINGTSVVFNGTEYWYVFNAQNDVIGLIDASGNYVVEYTYDAWGNPLSKSGSLADTLGTFNPFRYRGYIYDEETGWYYCQSRYYDPNVGRWLNADKYTSTGQGIIGNNMFVYCGNNPVSRIDYTGSSWEEILLDAVETVTNIISEITAYAAQKYAANSASGSAGSIIGGGVYRQLPNGLAAAYVSKSNSLSAVSQGANTVGKVLGAVGMAISVVNTSITVYENFNNDELSFSRKITDSVVDVGVTAGTIWTMGYIGATVGAGVPIPGVGPAAGFLVGVGIGLLTEYTPIVDWVKDGVDWAVNGIGGFFKELFG
ncbi:MAG: RHS repeat-associated core domain-containing protein, partial [Clostridia bacterium]|nr:RHS repeat-associated core domain-containing protein [Clostridia bacterium]